MPASPRSKPRPESLGPVLDALPVGLYVVDRDLVVVAWNQRRELGPIGRPRGRAVGRPLAAVLGKAGFRATEPVLREVLRTGQPHEETVETKGGLFHVRRLPVRQGRAVTHVVSWFEDITARRELEMRLIASDRLAFLGQLVSGVAHEISNPLAGIAGCAEALASLAAKADRALRARGAAVPGPHPGGGRPLRDDRALPARRVPRGPRGAGGPRRDRRPRPCGCSSGTPRSPASA